MLPPNVAREKLLEGLTDNQKEAVQAADRQLLIVAGAGSGKTEVMARRVAWWTAVEGVPKDQIVAFTFTERAAEEMKFRIRKWIEAITEKGEDVSLGGMYIGTIHGFCLKLLREQRADLYYNFDVIDDSARMALVQRVYHGLLGLKALQQAFSTTRQTGQFECIKRFLQAYDVLNECNVLDVKLKTALPPHRLEEEWAWCKEAELRTDIGSTAEAKAMAVSAARYYAYLHTRRFLDFSTAQAQLVRALAADSEFLGQVRASITHWVVDEVQDLNQIQDSLLRLLLGESGQLTAVGDHRQAIYAFRGGRIDLMAKLHAETGASPEGRVVELPHNFRSTSRVIDVANEWARTITPLGTLASPDMLHGNTGRQDYDASHVGLNSFQTRDDEADWIAQRIRDLVPGDGTGAVQDTRAGTERGIAYSDIALLVRSSTDARAYMTAMERAGIPAVVRAGPDLFSQPEVLLFLAIFGRMGGVDQFFGANWDQRSIPNRSANVLGCPPNPDEMVGAAVQLLRNIGLPMRQDAADHLLLLADLIQQRVESGAPAPPHEVQRFENPGLVRWLARAKKPRRLFLQTLFHWVLSEAGVHQWDNAASGRGNTAMFHLGQLSTLVKSLETPGWVGADDFRYVVIALSIWGASNARADEAPLLVQPDAVTISTIHAVKGLEFSVVFLADVNSQRFPSNMTRKRVQLPFDGDILNTIRPNAFSDNANYDHERRLMYVALTRAERYLFVSRSGRRQSQFFRALAPMVRRASGAVNDQSIPNRLRHQETDYRRDLRLSTSFSDLRYYLECPHDFYLRKVLGFAPTIDQAFGYGRGVHGLMRAVHADPRRWAALAEKPAELQAAILGLIDQGLFYLRYTTKDPAERMQNKAQSLVKRYVADYKAELDQLDFEPEKEFETLFEEEQILVSGAIDVIRLDDPPRVTLIDFKSGEPESSATSKLDEEEMRLQVTLYGIAAKHELEYEPDKGLVRYLDGDNDPKSRELSVALDEASLAEARKTVVETAAAIRSRKFDDGPRMPSEPESRCAKCDFCDFCGRAEATEARSKR